MSSKPLSLESGVGVTVDPEVDAARRTDVTHADRVLVRLIAVVPQILSAVLVERKSRHVLAARMRISADARRSASPEQIGPAVGHEIVGLVEWARACARLDATDQCEALRFQGDATWAVLTRGTSGRFVLGIVADRTAAASEVLQYARETLARIEAGAA